MHSYPLGLLKKEKKKKKKKVNEDKLKIDAKQKNQLKTKNEYKI